MCPGGVWSVSVCPHLPCKCLSLSFDVRTCSLSTNVLSDCDGTINVFHILCKPEWQWKRALFHFRSYFAKPAVVILTLDCRVGNATSKRRWFTFCGKFMCFAFLMLLWCPSSVYTICSHQWFDRGQQRQRTRLCASTWCVRVRQGVLCVLFLLLTGFRQISDCFKWARKVQSVEMYIIAISLVVD